MEPSRAGELEAVQQQLLIFARELNETIASERSRREEAEMALRALQESYMEMVRTLALVVEMKDSTTRTHLDRTYGYAMRLTQRVVPEMAKDATVGYGYLLHDIGKLGISEAILRKPGPLTDEEWTVMKTHPILGVQIVSPIKFLGEAIQVIRSHHERWDGKGYPQGLAGEEIHVAARIFSVVDTFDAITSERSYQEALPVDYALEEIERCGGTQFDPGIADEFVQMCEDLGIIGGDPEELHAIR
jgi:HD-GYP domain-containing protein (c-di-GMP phosphodiesterase class II)